HVSPEAAQGGPIAYVQDGDEIEIDITNRTLKWNVSDEELARRKENWKPLKKPMGPALKKYAAHVKSAAEGAIIEIK
ncbi:MAG: dihydroxy-acid dehydratase, partial [Synergistaceae bacterium]|nr:dihydroxy-acid dehydratase [Synergistaceae bacterium]